MQRKIIHCDCDCFFAAVEMRDNPSLISVPFAVGGSADRRGVISTCNYVARKYGVRSAMATAHALKLCPHLKVLSGNMQKYKAASAQVMAIFRDYADLIEPLSLDEAFLDVTDATKCSGSATLIAEDIRKRVSAEVGITVSAGVAPNKFLAKIASDWNKPNGIRVITPNEVESFVLQLTVDKISGVGAKTAEKLNRMGIYTCKDLRTYSYVGLLEQFGKFGQRLHELSLGIDERPVRSRRVRKSVSVEHTFADDLPDLHSCLVQLPALLGALEQRFEKYAGKRQVGGAVVKVKFCDFMQTTAEHTLRVADESHFRQLLIDAYHRGSKPVRLIGVGYKLKSYTTVSPQQLSLLS